MAFKTNESFLEKLTMGAAGTRHAAQYLSDRGHTVFELERGTTTNKIWSIKVKRLRLPDLQCLRCGVRVEARAKSKLEIKLSDSPTVPGREWDAGLRDQDLVVLVPFRADASGKRPAGPVTAFSVGALRAAVERSRLGPPKSSAEGAERDRTWPSVCPSRPGQVEDVADDRIRVRWEDGRTYSYRLREDKPFLYLGPGETFGAGDRLLLGSVEPLADSACPGAIWDPILDLGSHQAVDTYGAVKALGLIGQPSAAGALRQIARSHDDIRVRLEALGALARLGDDEAPRALGSIAQTTESQLDMAMEAVLILSELRSELSSAALRLIAVGRHLPDELRAAAVWGLAVTSEHPGDAVPFLGDEDDLVALHAIAGSTRGLRDAELRTLAAMVDGSARQAAAAVYVLSRYGARGARELLRLALESDGQTRLWALYGLGEAGKDEVVEATGGELPDDLESLLEPMWQAHQSWLGTGPNMTALDFLQRQLLSVPLIHDSEPRSDPLEQRRSR